MDEIAKKFPEKTSALILVAFGHGKQERAIAYWKKQYPRSSHIFIGVGGTLDMWAGVTPRAPRMFRKMGLEWLWRLCIQPRRFWRILRATCVFPLRVFWEFMLY
jgi:exopolysaccharide biosynthesis WecB/TagA/CpsF family protein